MLRTKEGVEKNKEGEGGGGGGCEGYRELTREEENSYDRINQNQEIDS